ncbi:hypothetical protein VQH23_21130 [Pararoseomonas sp. SCSIO 73927]|uniref:hypothetical protein n=1 Tax=Pararoseomonas sp. SCSIO 73927 TaxID=3114537 RepID=UPI0030CDB558
MTAVTAELGLLPDTDVVRPRLWLGDTVHAQGRLFDARRAPSAATDVTFLWVRPDGVELQVVGVPDTAVPGAWRGSFEVTMPGPWAVRLMCGNPSRQIAWRRFDVQPGYGGVQPDSPMWLAGNDGPVLTYGGGVLSAQRVQAMEPADELLPTDKVAVSRADGSSLALTGAKVLGAAADVATAVTEYSSEFIPTLTTPMLRKVRQFLDIEFDFKAKMDGASDDTAPLVDAVRSGSRVLFPPEYRPLVTYDEAKTNGPCRLEGNGKLSPIIQMNYCMRVVRVMDEDCYLSGLRFVNPLPMVKPTSPAKPGGYWPYGAPTEGLNDAMGQIAALHITGNRFRGRDLGFTNFPVSIRARPVNMATDQLLGLDLRDVFVRNSDFGFLTTSIADFYVEMAFDTVTCTDVNKATGAVRPPHAWYNTNPGALAEFPDEEVDDTPTMRLTERGVVHMRTRNSPFSDSYKLRGTRNIEAHLYTHTQETGLHISYGENAHIFLTAHDMAPGLVWSVAEQKFVAAPNGAGVGLNCAFQSNMSAYAQIVGRPGYNMWTGFNTYKQSDRCVMLGGSITRTSTAALNNPFARFGDGSTNCGMKDVELVDKGLEGDHYAVMDVGGIGTRIERLNITRNNPAAVKAYYIGSTSRNVTILAPEGLLPNETPAALEDYGQGTTVKKGVYLTHAQLPPPPRVPGHVAVLKLGSDGKTDETIISTGTAWQYLLTRAPVQAITFAAQPGDLQTGGLVQAVASVTNVAKVRFVLLLAGAEVPGTEVFATVANGAAAYSLPAPAVAAGYTLRAEAPGSPALAATSAPFAVSAAAPFSWVPSDLGAGLIFAADATDPAGSPDAGGGVAAELRHLYDPARKLVAVAAVDRPTILAGQGYTADKRALGFPGLPMLRAPAGSPILAAATGNIESLGVALVFSGALSASSASIGWWGAGTGGSSTTRIQFRRGWQLLLRGPVGAVQTLQSSNAPDGLAHTWAIVLTPGRALVLQDGIDKPIIDAPITTTSGAFSPAEFMVAGTIVSGVPTGASLGYLGAMVVSGSVSVAPNGPVHNAMRWAARRVGFVMS